jgi:hypothetical protein
MRPIYKFLEVDNFHAISDEVYNYVVNHTDILKSQEPVFFTDTDVQHALEHVPLLSDFLNQRLLIPTKFSIIVVPANMDPYLHVDTKDAFVRILWPVRNCKGSRTKFYDIPRKYLKLSRLPNEGVIYYDIIKQHNWEQVDEFELSAPLIFDASVAHAVHPAPDATGHRISFSLGFDRELPISQSVNAWFEFQQ